MIDKGHQSGVIPFRLQDGEIEILLITSSSGKRWVIPKGIVEPELDAIESARKEAMEEAGIAGNILDEPVGSYNQKKWGVRWLVTLYMLEVTRIEADWPEARVRDRKWVPLADATTMVARDGIRKLIRRVPEIIARGSSR